VFQNSVVCFVRFLFHKLKNKLCMWHIAQHNWDKTSWNKYITISIVLYMHLHTR
jgi:hypothetical protein